MTVAPESSAWILALPFAAIGLPLLVTGTLLLKRRLTARLRGRLVDAEVVHREPHRVPVAARRAPGANAAPTVTLHLRYLDTNGGQQIARLDHQVQQRLRSERYRLRYPLGARLRVRIDPERPDIAYDDTVGYMIVLPVLLCLAGLLGTLLALGIFFG